MLIGSHQGLQHAARPTWIAITAIPMAILFAAAGWIAFVVPVFSVAVQASQDQAERAAADARPWKFAVVSIRRNKTGGPQQFGAPTPDGYRMENMFMAAPIVTAYVPTAGGTALYSDDQMVGMPEWLYSDTEHYDIDAKVDEADLADWQNPAQQPAMMRTMLQAMLKDRLKLVVHRSTKEGPVYSLTVGRNGPKFKETNSAEPHPGAYPFPGGGMVAMHLESGEVTAYYFGITMGQLTGSLLGSAGRPIQDNTGLTGKYDITIRKPAPATSNENGSQRPVPAPEAEPSAPSIAEQLGLKLQPARGTVENLVIDHVERPSAN